MISYVTVDGEYVAYHVDGDGPDVLLVPSFASGSVELRATSDPANGWYRQLQRTCRMVTFDRRGSGASERPWRQLTLDDWAEDAVAVLDEVGSQQCIIVGQSDATPLATTLAVEHRERIRGLVLVNPLPRYRRGPDWPAGRTWSEIEALLPMIRATWGRDDVPVDGEDPPDFAIVRRTERIAGTPTDIERTLRMLYDADVRDLLPHVDVPVTVVHRPDAAGFKPNVPLFLELVPHAAVVTMPGSSRLLQKSAPLLVDTIRRCALGDHSDDRAIRSIATILFADVVGSTELARSLGDDAWRRRLDDHDEHLARVASANGGRIANTAGDGTLALFDSPTAAIGAAVDLVSPHPSLLPLRVGVHCGEVEVRGTDVAGIAVHVGARVGGLAGSGEVLVSRTVRDLVAGGAITLAPRGRHELKGVDEEWELFAVVT